MAKYRITNKAVNDLENIWKYTMDTWPERLADTYYLLVERITKKLPKTYTGSKPANTSYFTE